MISDADVLEAFDARAKRREERRDFFRTLGAAAMVGGGLYLTGRSTAAGAQTSLSDPDVLNFALNLEYLEAQFYSYAATGAGLPYDMLTGAGSPGYIWAGRQVNFTDPAVASFAREIAADEAAHVAFLRNALGDAAVATPEIDISVSADSAFSAAARAAGLIGEGETFDPYASDENFLLAAFIFEDVGVTAYKGAAPLLSNATYVEAAAGILAVEAYHASLIRTTLYTKGIQTPSLIEATEAISDARDSLDGETDLDQGVAAMGDTSNIAPLDENGIAFGREAGQVLNIVYLNNASVTGGGFFPSGVHGNVNMSAAN